jgi:hypothetical protein
MPLKPSWIQRLLGRQPQNNALIAVQNLLATRDLSSITATDVVREVALYGGTLRNLKGELARLYSTCLEHHLASGPAGESEQATGARSHLRVILGLEAKSIESVHRAAYRALVNATIADGALTDERERHLNQWRERLAVSDSVHEEVYREEAYPIFRRHFDQVMAKGMLSPQDEGMLKRLADNLGVAVLHNADTERHLDQLRYYWQIECGELEPVPTTLNLGRSEVCYWTGRAEFLNFTTRTERTGYSGMMVSARVMKGVYWRTASYRPIRQVTQIMTAEPGTLLVTSKRLIFAGSLKSTVIGLGRILAFEPFSDGVRIDKGSGKRPLFRITHGDTATFHRILSRAIRDTNEPQ